MTTSIAWEIFTTTQTGLSQPNNPQTDGNIAQQVPHIIPYKPDKFTPRLLPVGLIVNDRTKLESISVLGDENATAAVNFENWLLPFDELIQALGFKLKEIDGQLELSTSSQKFRLTPNSVIPNKTLGRAISVRYLAAIPGFKVKFDIYKYALDITMPSGGIDRFGVDAPSISLDGLTTVKPPNSAGMSIIQQRLNTSAAIGASNEVQGELRAAGHLGNAGWYLQFNQRSMTDLQNWNLNDAVILHQDNTNDQIFGAQNPFWRTRTTSTGSFWGATNVYRRGFEPPVSFSGGEYVLGERLQARRTGRTISGTTEPGTIVQLVKNDRRVLVREMLVDSSGIYRFDNIIVSGNTDESLVGRDYQILLYPRGQLTANPIIRDITFTSFAGQIPVGADAVVVSLGANRLTAGNFGAFDFLQGGVLYRRGMTESLTIGLGAAQDRHFQGVGELFWQPTNPVEISMSATIAPSQFDYIGRLNYRPSPDFSLSANSDRLSTSANVYWRLGDNFAATSNYESLRGSSIGTEYFSSTPTTYTDLKADIDNRGRIRTTASQRWQDWQGTYQSNESATNLQLTYRPPLDGRDERQEFVLGYQNSRQATRSALTTALWRYHSPQRLRDGRSVFQTELGYGINSLNQSGLIASADLNLIPGLQFRGSYRGVSDISGQGNYALEVTSTLLTSGGVRGTFDRVEDFRTLGKVVFQPFLDKNQNGRQDPGEEGYWDPLLLRINDRPIAQYRPQVSDNRGDLNLPTGSYRVDVDPAGYPINYQSRKDAVRLELVSSGVTTLTIPLVPAYISIGIVKDSRGNVVSGARVEATHLATKTKISSITNDAGFYTLEGLEQGEYRLMVSDLATTPDRLKIKPSSQPTQELNLQIEIPTDSRSPAPKPGKISQGIKIDRRVNF